VTIAGQTARGRRDLRGRRSGQLLAYVGSAATIEIAVRDGRADTRLAVERAPRSCRPAEVARTDERRAAPTRAGPGERAAIAVRTPGPVLELTVTALARAAMGSRATRPGASRSSAHGAGRTSCARRSARRRRRSRARSSSRSWRRRRIASSRGAGTSRAAAEAASGNTWRAASSSRRSTATSLVRCASSSGWWSIRSRHRRRRCTGGAARGSTSRQARSACTSSTATRDRDRSLSRSSKRRSTPRSPGRVVVSARRELALVVGHAGDVAVAVDRPWRGAPALVGKAAIRGVIAGGEVHGAPVIEIEPGLWGGRGRSRRRAPPATPR